MNRVHLPLIPRQPDGLSGLRSLDSPCELFLPGEPMPEGECLGDGHYLCKECDNLTIAMEDKPWSRFTRLLLYDLDGYLRLPPPPGPRAEPTTMWTVAYASDVCGGMKLQTYRTRDEAQVFAEVLFRGGVQDVIVRQLPSDTFDAKNNELPVYGRFKPRDIL
jgi:hypothetical protein